MILDKKVFLTVGQLRDKLKDLPDDIIVHTEGCDCIGEACDAVVEERKTWWNGQDHIDEPHTVLIIERFHGR